MHNYATKAKCAPGHPYYPSGFPPIMMALRPLVLSAKAKSALIMYLVGRAVLLTSSRTSESDSIFVGKREC